MSNSSLYDEAYFRDLCDRQKAMILNMCEKLGISQDLELKSDAFKSTVYSRELQIVLASRIREMHGLIRKANDEKLDRAFYNQRKLSDAL